MGIFEVGASPLAAGARGTRAAESESPRLRMQPAMDSKSAVTDNTEHLQHHEQCEIAVNKAESNATDGDTRANAAVAEDGPEPLPRLHTQPVDDDYKVVDSGERPSKKKCSEHTDNVFGPTVYEETPFEYSDVAGNQVNIVTPEKQYRNVGTMTEDDNTTTWITTATVWGIPTPLRCNSPSGMVYHLFKPVNLKRERPDHSANDLAHGAALGSGACRSPFAQSAVMPEDDTVYSDGSGRVSSSLPDEHDETDFDDLSVDSPTLSTPPASPESLRERAWREDVGSGSGSIETSNRLHLQWHRLCSCPIAMRLSRGGQKQ